MKAITLQQPWATLMAIGAKRIETRAWPTSYRGPLVIHASAKWNREVLEELSLALKPPICDGDSDWRQMIAALVGSGYTTLGELPLGAAICLVEVIDCRPVEVLAKNLDENELAFGDFSQGLGRFGFVTRFISNFALPIPYKGRLGLWDFPDELVPEEFR